MYKSSMIGHYDSYSLLSPTAAGLPTNLNAVQVNFSSFSVSWTPPATVTGYQVYWSGDGGADSGNMSVEAEDTAVTITDRTPGLTYNITLVALSNHLPSPAVGAVMVTLGADMVTFGEPYAEIVVLLNIHIYVESAVVCKYLHQSCLRALLVLLDIYSVHSIQGWFVFCLFFRKYTNVAPGYTMSTSDGIWVFCWCSCGSMYWHSSALHYDSTCVNLCTDLLE